MIERSIDRSPIASINNNLSSRPPIDPINWAPLLSPPARLPDLAGDRPPPMELHHPHAAAKKLWNYLRLAFFVARSKGFASKRRLLVDMSLLMKRGNKVLGKSLAAVLTFHHHHHHHSSRETPSFFGRREYEFSCSNSPANPVFYHGGKAQQRRHHHYFPCLHADVAVEDDDAAAAVVLPPRIQYSSSSSSLLHYSQELASSSLISSPLVVNYPSRDDEIDEEDDKVSGREVDDEAEEFIRRFYEQLRAQSRIALLQYQELEYI